MKNNVIYLVFLGFNVTIAEELWMNCTCRKLLGNMNFKSVRIHSQ